MATNKLPVKTIAPESGLGKRMAEVQRLKVEIDRLNEELTGHKSRLLAYAVRNGFSALKMGALTVSRRVTHNWTYSALLSKAYEKIKARMAKEQASGVATDRPTESLVVNISGSAVLQQAAALEALVARTPSQPATVHGEDFVPRSLADAEEGVAVQV